MTNSSAVSLEPGTQIVWKTRVYEVHGMWSGTEVLLRDPATQKNHVAPIDALEPYLEDAAVVAMPALHGIPEDQWDRVIERFSLVAGLAAQPQLTGTDYERVATQLHTSTATVRRWLNKFRRTGTVSALLHSRPGPQPGIRKLNPEIEELIAGQIKSRWMTREEIRQSEFIKDVQRLARARGLNVPCGKAILVRLRNLPDRQSLRARRGKKVANERYQAVTGTHALSMALEEVQIDHTLVDIIVVSDDERRDPIARPFLSLAIDVYTRAIVGYYLSLDKPDAYALGLCVANACLPKEALLKDLGIHDASWPMQGRMQKLFMDNAKEHHAIALRRGCDAQLILLEYRPPGKPYYGGHIERLIGTMMRRLHALPGSSRSDISARGDYDPARTAVMTLPELEKYLVLQILAYNSEVHSSLSMSPNRAWEQAMASIEASCRPVVPPASPEFFASFMPFQRRTVRRDGIELFRNTYWNEALEPLIGHAEKLDVHYDPRDMSRVLVRDPSGLLIPAYCTDSAMPRLSLREWTFIKRRAAAAGRCPHEVATNDRLLDEAEQLEEEATKKQRKAKRKRSEALRHTLANADRTQRLHDAWPSPAAPLTPAPVDFDPDSVAPFTVHREV